MDEKVYLDLSLDKNPPERVVLKLTDAHDPDAAMSLKRVCEGRQANKDTYFTPVKFHYSLSQRQEVDPPSEEEEEEEEKIPLSNSVEAYIWPCFSQEESFAVLFTHMPFLDRCYPVQGIAIEGIETLRKIHMPTKLIEITNFGTVKGITGNTWRRAKRPNSVLESHPFKTIRTDEGKKKVTSSAEDNVMERDKENVIESDEGITSNTGRSAKRPKFGVESPPSKTIRTDEGKKKVTSSAEDNVLESDKDNDQSSSHPYYCPWIISVTDNNGRWIPKFDPYKMPKTDKDYHNWSSPPNTSIIEEQYNVMESDEVKKRIASSLAYLDDQSSDPYFHIRFAWKRAQNKVMGV